MQLASILSMSCNIQHLAQQQWQRKIKWSMLRKRYFLHFRRAEKVNRQCGLLNHIIKWITERVAWRPKESEPLGHCVAWDPKRRLRRRNDEKRTSQPIKSKTNELRIMLREKPLGQERELKTQRQRLGKSRKIWSMVKSRDWQTESLKSVLRRWLLLSETVWVMLQVPTMGRMGKMEMMKRQSRANWAKMTNPAGWWALSPNSTAAYGEVSAEADEACRVDTTGMWRCSWLLLWKRWDVRHIWIERSGCHSTPNGWWRCGTCIDNSCSTYGVSWDCPWNTVNAASDFSTRK